MTRYGLDGRSPERLQDVADRLDLSREGVRKLRQRAEDSLRHGRGLCRAS
jgi:DNA-directed RNA polymerase sigma subunit (sigma70/sigma32)